MRTCILRSACGRVEVHFHDKDEHDSFTIKNFIRAELSLSELKTLRDQISEHLCEPPCLPSGYVRVDEKWLSRVMNWLKEASDIYEG